MSVTVTRRHPDVPAEIVELAQKKGEKLEKEFPRVEYTHGILDSQNFLHKAEFAVQAKDHIRIEADESHEDWRVAVEEAYRKAARQLRSLRDKMTDHRSRVRTSDFEQQLASERDA